MYVGLFLILCLFGPIIGYIFGSILFAILLSKTIKQKDIRKFGSHNPGFTNTLRTFGIKFSILILFLDLLKVIIPTLIIYLIVNYASNIHNQLIELNSKNSFNFLFLIYLTPIFAILGHIFPIFHKFKGGKGVASYFGFLLILSPFIFLITALLLISILLIKKIMSLSSIISIFISPFLFLIPGVNYFYLIDSNFINTIDYSINNYVWLLIIWGLILSIAILIIFKHKSNIINIINKKEKEITIFG